ncbi:MAG: alpha/beta hydrolase [Bacteroidota bacterium]
MKNAQNIIIPLWDADIPNYREAGEENTEISRDGLEVYTLISKPEISVYLPSKRNANGQAVLIIPGGGYEAVVHVWEGDDVAKWLNSNGIAAIVLKYRLPHAKSNIERDKSPLLDAARAMRIIRANAEKWHIKKDNIGVMGFSAGGHLASTLGTHFNKSVFEIKDKDDSLSARPDFMILIYPVISMSAEFAHEGSRYFFLGENPDKELMEYYSNEKHITKDTPPTFLLHSSDDDVVPVENSIAFYKELVKNNIDTEMHIFQHGEHGFSLANGQGSVEAWKGLCVNWLKNFNKSINGL